MLVNRQNHEPFQPLLYQVATAGLSAPEIAQPARSILRDQPNVSVRLDEVNAIDLATKRVHLARGTFDYDFLVIALGGVTSCFGHPEWEAFAPRLKSLDDALRIRREALLAFERAENEPNRAAPERLLTIVVVGGGPTGVELAGAFAELTRHVLAAIFATLIPARRARSCWKAAIAYWRTWRLNCRRARTSSWKRSVSKCDSTPRSAESQTGWWNSPMARASKHSTSSGQQGFLRVRSPARSRREQSRRTRERAARSQPTRTSRGVRHRRSGAGVAKGPETCSRCFTGGDSTSATRREAHQYRTCSIGSRGHAASGVQVLGQGLDGHGWPLSCHGGDQQNSFQRLPRGLALLFVHQIFLVGLRNKLAVQLEWLYPYCTYERSARIVTGVARTISEST